MIVVDDEPGLRKMRAEHPGKHGFSTRTAADTRELDAHPARSRGPEPFDRSIDVRITRLRRKLERDPEKPQLIRTIREAGDIFVPGLS